jgi:hypothetical protein
MKKEFVPYEIALALKELGFDEPCFYYYNLDKKLFQVYNKYKINDTFKNSQDDHNIMLSAPLYQQAFRWFREKYGLYYKIHGYSDNTSFVFDIADGDFETYYDECPTYEEAELACLIKLIEIVKNK